MTARGLKLPRRIVDGEKTWGSDKLHQVQPESYRAEYPWLLPLANDVGSFECNPEQVWFRAYAYNRKSVTEKDVSKFLEEFERVGLLYRWKVDGKEWGYWIGMDRPGLLPKPSERYSKGPRPSDAELERFLGGLPAGDPREFATGLGLGIGSGSGIGSSDTAEEDSKVFQIEE
jgi:hypothetical protein